MGIADVKFGARDAKEKNKVQVVLNVESSLQGILHYKVYFTFYILLLYYLVSLLDPV